MMGVNGASKIPANCVCVVCDLHVAVFLKTDRTVSTWQLYFLFCGLLLWQDFPSKQEVTRRTK